MDTNKKILLVIGVVMAVSFAVTTGVGQGCTPVYNTLGLTNHTMCIYNANACQPGLTLVVSGVLNTTYQKIIVDYHNKLRQSIVTGIAGSPGTLKAIKMPLMTYDSELAMIAQRAAEQCLFAHDKNRNVVRFKVGQNIYVSSNKPPTSDLNPNMTRAIDAWFKEIISPGFPNANISPFVFVSGAGHYTQIAWENSTSVGCGYVYYRNGTLSSSKLIFCNYGPAGNILKGTMYRVAPATG